MWVGICWCCSGKVAAPHPLSERQYFQVRVSPLQYAGTWCLLKRFCLLLLRGKLPNSSGHVLLMKWDRFRDPPGREGWRILREGVNIWNFTGFAGHGSQLHIWTHGSRHLQTHAQGLHEIKPTKIPAWVEEESMNSNTCLRNYYQLMNKEGRRVSSPGPRPKRETTHTPVDDFTQLHTWALLNGLSVSVKSEF